MKYHFLNLELTRRDKMERYRFIGVYKDTNKRFVKLVNTGLGYDQAKIIFDNDHNSDNSLVLKSCRDSSGKFVRLYDKDSKEMSFVRS
jgi:hypothetical protein